MRVPKLVAVGAAAAALLLVTGATPAYAAVDNDPANLTSCQGVFQGAGGSGSLTKSLVSVVDNGDGSWTITFEVTSDRPAGTYRLRDCAFTDTNGNGQYDDGEALFGTDEKDVTLGSSGTVQASITVSGTANDTVCDRTALSGTDPNTQASFTDKSNYLCTTLTETQVPSGTIGGLGLAAAGAAALGLVTVGTRMRRRRPNTSG